MKPNAAVLSVILDLALLAAPVPSPGQQPAKVYRIGNLQADPAPTDQTPEHCPVKGSPLWQALVEGLGERGYIQGQNLVIVCRYTGGRLERAPALAAELVSLKPDLIVAAGTVSTRAIKQATSTIPIVMVYVLDPVTAGLVASLARPGGNVTGVTMDAGLEILGKHLQFLKEAVPTVSRVAVLSYAVHPLRATILRETQAAAQALGVTLQTYEVREPEEFAGAFTAMTKARAEALLVLPHPFTYVHARRIATLAAQSRLPAVYPFREAVEAGGLLAYATNTPDMFRRAATFVDKIFKGANPGDLPVEQPTKFDLLVNLKAAKALGLTIPQSLLNRADEVIQ
ncbi:MAG TPA: ABC transporter substrate-binding protein [Candidatus Methylomirabilis sp.]|nr:ABC transporter substrate-binding protein [Candidatus Methylomirabilis sp.]